MGLAEPSDLRVRRPAVGDQHVHGIEWLEMDEAVDANLGRIGQCDYLCCTRDHHSLHAGLGEVVDRDAAFRDPIDSEKQLVEVHALNGALPIRIDSISGMSTSLFME